MQVSVFLTEFELIPNRLRSVLGNIEAYIYVGMRSLVPNQFIEMVNSKASAYFLREVTIKISGSFQGRANILRHIRR